MAGGESRPWATTAYRIQLLDEMGDQNTVLAFSVDEITRSVKPVDVTDVVGPQEASPAGKVDLLIGIQYAGLHAHGGEEGAVHGNLRLLLSRLGTGFLLDGTHPALCATPARMERSILHLTRGQLVYKATPGGKSKVVNHVGKQLFPAFLECEELGVSNPRRCGSCTNCWVC